MVGAGNRAQVKGSGDGCNIKEAEGASLRKTAEREARRRSRTQHTEKFRGRQSLGRPGTWVHRAGSPGGSSGRAYLYLGPWCQMCEQGSGRGWFAFLRDLVGGLLYSNTERGLWGGGEVGTRSAMS